MSKYIITKQITSKFYSQHKGRGEYWCDKEPRLWKRSQVDDDWAKPTASVKQMLMSWCHVPRTVQIFFSTTQVIIINNDILYFYNE